MSVASRFTEFVLLGMARLALWSGRRDRSRTLLKRVLRRNPGCFSARFLLGRVYLHEGAVFKAKREFDLAWQIQPERFERAYARLRAHTEAAPDLFSYEEEPERGGVRVALTESRARSYGDFRSREEHRRFQSLPPISRDEIAGIDWERLEQEIADEG